jgi:hypothetical protein
MWSVTTKQNTVNTSATATSNPTFHRANPGFIEA